jgi:hypothetical protein
MISRVIPSTFPRATALIIFLAVVIDTLRNAVADGLLRRLIRPDG